MDDGIEAGDLRGIERLPWVPGDLLAARGLRPHESGHLMTATLERGYERTAYQPGRTADQDLHARDSSLPRSWRSAKLDTVQSEFRSTSPESSFSSPFRGTNGKYQEVEQRRAQESA